MLLIRKDDIPVYHDKIIISKPGGILPIPPNFTVSNVTQHINVWLLFLIAITDILT